MIDGNEIFGRGNADFDAALFGGIAFNLGRNETKLDFDVALVRYNEGVKRSSWPQPPHLLKPIVLVPVEPGQVDKQLSVEVALAKAALGPQR